MKAKLKEKIEDYENKIKKIKFENKKKIKEYENKINEMKNEYDNITKKYDEYKKLTESRIKEINNEIILIYKTNKDKNKIKIFGNDFVKNNKNLCQIIYERKEYGLQSEFYVPNINKNKEIFEIKLKGILNISNLKNMFEGCSSLISAPDISKLDVTNMKSLNSMFQGCSS
jgi:sugar-specific transcriptional regulator TrmB